MRALAITTFVLGVTACSSQSAETQGPAPGPDATTVDPAYCAKYCEAQANNGTLAGTLKDCEKDCCTRVPDGCSDVDGSSPGDGGGSRDTGTQDAGDDAPDDGGTGDGPACATPCGSQCCPANQGCSTDGIGNPTCVPTCQTKDDCPSGCCAPATNAAGDPVGPYICKPNDGQAYHCCYGITVNCGANHCCVSDTDGNEFCAVPCTSNTPCGAAHCAGYSFGTLTTSCHGFSTACGP
jgi:hypothetical protein